MAKSSLFTAPASTTAEPGDEFKTEAQKSPPDPVSPPVEPGPPVEVMKLAPTEPYPTGSPQDPEAGFEAAHGFRRVKE